MNDAVTVALVVGAFLAGSWWARRSADCGCDKAKVPTTTPPATDDGGSLWAAELASPFPMPDRFA